jgi:hypothetical protein
MQLVLDVFIFFARHTALAFVVFCALWWLGPGRWRGGPDGATAGSIRRTALGVSAATLAVFVLTAAWYVTRAGFAGEVESVVSSLSWQVQSGQPLYTSFEQAERYSVLYGPSVFLTNGLFLKILGPSLASAKVASALASVGCLVFLYASLRRRARDPVALAAAAGAALYFWAQGFAIYLVRPDALIVFAVAFGLYTATRSRRWLAIVAVAVAAGFTVNLKIHSILYFLPVIVVLARCHGLTAAVWSSLAAGLVALAPFALYPQISALNYLTWLTNETQHGFRLDLMPYPLSYAAFLCLPVVIVAWLRGRRLGYLGAERVVVLSLVPGLACGLVLSAKPGSGIVHLMPLVPATMYAVGRLFGPLADAGLPVWGPRLKRSAAVAVVLTAMLTGSVNLYRAARMFDWQLGQMPGIVADVQLIMDQYDGLPMAMAVGGENRCYRAAWLKPLLVFRDNPVLLDPISVMDTVKSGLGLADATYDALSEGRIALWLVPHAQVPFQKMSWYDPDVPIFPQEFVQHFQRCYTLRGQSRYFDLWFWNGLDPTPETAAPAYTLQEPKI